MQLFYDSLMYSHVRVSHGMADVSHFFVSAQIQTQMA